MMPGTHSQPEGAHPRSRATGDEALIAKLVSAIAAKPVRTVAEIQKALVAEFGFASVDSMLARDRGDARKLKARRIGMALCRAFNHANRARGNGSLTYVASRFKRDRTAVRAADRVYGAAVRAAIAGLTEDP